MIQVMYTVPQIDLAWQALVGCRERLRKALLGLYLLKGPRITLVCGLNCQGTP